MNAKICVPLLVAASLLVPAGWRLDAQTTTPASGPVAAPVLEVGGVVLDESDLQLVLEDAGLPTNPVDEAVRLGELGGELTLSRQAAAKILVERERAMVALEELGGAALEGIIRRELQRLDEEEQRRGKSLKEHALGIGVSPEAYRRHLRWKIAWGEYLKSRVTDENLRKFYESNAGRYGKTSYRVSQIFLASADADSGDEGREALVKSIDDKLRHTSELPNTFAELARQHSQAGSSEFGGDMGWVTLEGDLPREIIDQLRNASPGDLIGPIISSWGVHWVFVAEVKTNDKKTDPIADISRIRSDYTQTLFSELAKRKAKIPALFRDARLNRTEEN